MATRCAIYLVAHQPRRLRLPSPVVPAGMSTTGVERVLFDDAMNRAYFHRVLEKSYAPTTELLSRFATSGTPLNLGMSGSLRWQAERWAPDWLARWDALLRMDAVEAVAVEPHHGFLFAVDMPAFVRSMRREAQAIQSRSGRRPRVADTTEMWHSPALAAGLSDAGFRAQVADGRPSLLGWRLPTHLYRLPEPPGLFVVPRHVELSDDVGYRFSDRTWDGWPLRPDDYARWIREAEGSFVFIAWDFETFGEHHWAESGIFEFLTELPEALDRAGVTLCRLGDLVEELGVTSYELPTVSDAVTWAGTGSPDFFLGNAPQRQIFRLMHDVYALGQRRGPAAAEVARWLLQSDHLHLLHWYGRTGPEAEVSAYFTPKEWWPLGGEGIVREMVEVYRQFANWALVASPGQSGAARRNR